MEEAPDHFKNLLQNIATEQGFVNYDLNIKAISSGGANYTSKLYTVTVKEGARELNMFAKVAAVGEKFRSQAPKFYETENFFYTNLSKTYEKLEEDHNIPEEFKFNFPKFYGCNPKTFEETIVLENLLLDGYMAFDRFKAMDWSYASAAVTELAKMHALSFAHEHCYPEDFKKVTEKLKFDFNMETPEMKAYFEGVLTRGIAATGEEHRGKLQRYYEQFNPEEFMDFYKGSKRGVLGHGDFRPSNLLHRLREDGKVDIKVADMQTLQSSSPVTDLMYFIFTGSDEQFRARYYDKLVEHYYTELAAAMTRLHLDPDITYSREDFQNEVKQKLPLGLTLSIFALPIVTVETEDAPKVDEDMDFTNFSIQTNDLFVERLNGVINDYVKWGILV